MKAQSVTTAQHADVDAAFDRVVDLLDAHRDIGIIDTADGDTVLDWRTTTDLANVIASDSVLAELISRQQLGGAA